MNTKAEQKSQSGVWITKSRAACAVCGTVTEFESPLYIHDESWSNFGEMVTEGKIQSHVCSQCNNSLEIPIIFDSSHYGILVFITGQGDHKDIQNNFKKLLDVAVNNISVEIADNARKKPYCIVNGWHGFKTFLECLNDIAPHADKDNNVENNDEGFYVAKATGYIYGDLFFYYPDQIVIEETAKGFMQIARNHRLHGRLDLAHNVLNEGIKVIGETHQWMVQELGATAFEAGDSEAAKKWLKKAIILQHKWLAPTMSFLDATPTKRADGETQDNSLPHAEPISHKGKLTSNRHVVIRHFPPVSDYKLWYFPILQEYVIPPEHFQIERRLISYAVALGEFMYSLELHEETTIDIMGSYHSIVEEYLEYMRQIKQPDVRVPEKLNHIFWLEYILRRWRIPKNYEEISQHSNIEARNKWTKLIGNVMGVIGKDVRILKQQKNTAIEIFFLEHSLDALFNLAEYFINLCPVEEQNELITLRLQAEVDTLSDVPGQWTISMAH